MKESFVQQLLFYRYRYAISYVLIVLVGIGALFFALGSLGPGLHSAEQAQAVTSSQWDWKGWQQGLSVVNLPYILLQKASILLFGLSTWSIRLPSVIIGSLTIVFFFLLLRSWHKSYSALIATVLFVSSSWLVAIARFGTPDIMVPFIWSGLLLCATQLVRHQGNKLPAWTALGAILAALACYTPYGVWVLLGLFVTILAHPQALRAAKLLGGQHLALLLFIFIPLIVPLGWGIYHHPDQAWTVSGLQSHLPTVTEFFKNILTALEALVWKAPEFSALRLGTLPVLAVGTVALLLAGIVRAAIDWRSIRSQFLLLIFAFSCITLGLNPANTSFSLFIIPVYLLIATGVTVLFREWYRLFPRNPYARSFALLPIALLIAVIVTYHYQRYFVAWASVPATYQAYNNDIDSVNKVIKSRPSLTIMVKPDQVGFYKILEKKHKGVTVVSAAPRTISGQQAALVAEGVGIPKSTNHLRGPITNDDKENSLRFWLIFPAQ